MASRGRDTDIFGVTRTAVPSVYFHLPVFAGKRQRCQQFSAERLQSHHNYCGGAGGGGQELGAGVQETGPKRKRWGPKQLLPLPFSLVPEAARFAQTEQFGRIERDPNSAGGRGWGRGHLDQRLWSLGKAVSRGRDLETPGKGGWLEPKDSPGRYQGQGERQLLW